MTKYIWLELVRGAFECMLLNGVNMALFQINMVVEAMKFQPIETIDIYCPVKQMVEFNQVTLFNQFKLRLC